MQVPGAGSWQDRHIEGVYYVPALTCNLYSISVAVQRQGKVVTFRGKTVEVRQETTDVLSAAGTLTSGGVYQLNFVSRRHLQAMPVTTTSIEEKSCDTDKEVMRWHQRFGHLSLGNLQLLEKKCLVRGLNCSFPSKGRICESCLAGQQHRLPFPTSTTQTTRPLELVHSDVVGPLEVESLGGSRYFVTFIDDYSRYTFVYSMKKKSDVLDKLKSYQRLVEKQTGYQLKKFRSDNGGEYVSCESQAYFNQQGRQHQLTVARTPEQNGVAERFNRTVIEKTRT